MTDTRIRFSGISKWFGQLCVVDDLDLSIARGEFVSLLGPSGSGKTTLLMMLAGFEAQTSGTIEIDGRPIDRLPPHKRNMGVVFQNYALFPHMSVAQNVAFPLAMRGAGKAETRERVERALAMVQLSTFGDRLPAQLSGGQQQRVALARALVFEPDVVLMDEPLGALDKNLRERMQLDIRELHERLGLTIVFVTHDQSEALTMSDRIAVFNKGKIEQIGTPRQIYDAPRTRFVAEFIGETNLVEATVAGVEGAQARLRLASGREVLASVEERHAPGDAVLLSVRPERIRVGEPGAELANRFEASVVDSVYQGDRLRVELGGAGSGQGGGETFVAHLDRLSREWPKGTRVCAGFRPQDCRVIRP